VTCVDFLENAAPPACYAIRHGRIGGVEGIFHKPGVGDIVIL
jgi:hypothetical protein